MGILCVAGLRPVKGTRPRLIRQKEGGDTDREEAGSFSESDPVPRSRGKLDLQALPVEVIVGLEGLDDHVVDREPDGAAPVGIPPEHPGPPLARLVVDREGGSVDRVDVGFLLVVLGDRADAVRREELTLVKEITQHPLQSGTRRDRQQDILVDVHDIAVHVEKMPGNLGSVIDRPEEAGLEARALPPLESGHVTRGDERHESLDGADLDRHMPPVGKLQQVVVEPVLLIPEA